ncbi:MAG: hypothetical protein LUC88_03520 [Prevotella sp.]|nr:hypothetical protein [Prevotella sp.]
MKVYSQIDCSQFNELTKKFVGEAKKQINERKDKAYNDAIKKVGFYEQLHDYDNMIEWAKKALKYHKGDNYASEKLQQAQNLKDKQVIKNQDYLDLISKARTARAEGRLQDAIVFCKSALNLRQDSDEALLIKNDSEKQIEIERLIKSAVEFFSKKNYLEALKKVEDILNLEPNNNKAKKIKSKVSEILSKQEKNISNLVSALNDAENKKEYNTAIKYCDDLILVDVLNSYKWKDKMSQLTSLQQTYNEILSLKQEKDWEKLITACESFLALSPTDVEVNKILKAVREDLELQQIQIEFNNAYEERNWKLVISIYEQNPILSKKKSNTYTVNQARKYLKGKKSKPLRTFIENEEINNSDKNYGNGSHPQPKPNGKRIKPNPIPKVSNEIETSLTLTKHEIDNSNETFVTKKAKRISNPHKPKFHKTKNIK